MSLNEPLIQATQVDFQEENWLVNAFEAARNGLSKTSLLEAFLNLFVSPGVPGGRADFPMGVQVGPGLFRSVLSSSSGALQRTFDGIPAQTMGELFAYTCEKHADSNCLGYRDILSMRLVDNKFEKYVLGGYNWHTYSEVFVMAQNFGRGLASLGVEQGHRVKFFAETKMEWQVAAQGCFQYGFVISTSYANLGKEALVYAINQTEVEVIFTDANLVAMVDDIADDCPSLKHIIYTRDPRPASFAGRLNDDVVRQNLKSTTTTVHSFEDVLKLGKDMQVEKPAVKPDDLAVIMYTSGSTGNPKGVMISHANMIASCLGTTNQIPEFSRNDFYIAYLPLAHILEMIAETGCLVKGAAIGYGTTKTITDSSVCIDIGTCKGDASELRPTLMAAVPAIMDKIRNGVNAKVEQAGGVKAKLFNTAYAKKAAALAQGLDTPLWNRLVFDALRARLLGGRLRFMLSGGGPLSKETQDFMNVVFCCPVGQGYGLTETVGCGSVVWPNDRTSGRVGPPVVTAEFQLVDWEEGGYFVDASKNEDKSVTNPRGEVIIGGPIVTMGYFKNDEKTQESYFEKDGQRWFRTGDIGEFCEDGVLRLIDRKKDLVKMSGGEYVSYGKLEPLLKDSPLVENAMVYAEMTESYCVAITTKPIGKNPTDEQVLEDITRILKKNGCAKFELPKKVRVVDEQWSPENDLATAALKLKRQNLRKYYDDLLKELYAQ